MEPNLRDRQYVIVDRLAYRRLYAVQRGDIIVFRSPRSPQYHFIGRIIGLPADAAILGAQLILTGQHAISSGNAGVWSVHVLDSSIDAGWPSRTIFW